MKFKYGDMVWMRRLGDSAPGEYRGQICGVSAIWNDVQFYIVDMIDVIPGQEQWSHVNLISSCIDPMEGETNVKKCLVHGCKNSSDQGTFIGDLCSPCHNMITTGNIHPCNITFIGKLYKKYITMKGKIEALLE